MAAIREVGLLCTRTAQRKGWKQWLGMLDPGSLDDGQRKSRRTWHGRPLEPRPATHFTMQSEFLRMLCGFDSDNFGSIESECRATRLRIRVCS
jgi:hypothetical protein